MSARAATAGACAALSAVVLGVGAIAWSLPGSHVLAPLARILDAGAPLMVLLGGLLALAAFALGARRIGGALSVACVLALGVGGLQYWRMSVPVRGDLPRDARVLFFNVLSENARPAQEIVQGIVAASADIVVLAEAGAILPAFEALQDAYTFVSPCDADSCEVVVASNLPVTRFWRLQINPFWAPRYGVLETRTPAGAPFFVVANHLAKPWLSGIAEPELPYLIAQLNWLEGPVLAVGDYNTTPWSEPMRRILRETGFRSLRGQPASWPEPAGIIGFPIDLALVRGGVAAAGLESFGAGLGSNHRGFIVDIAVGSAGPVAE